MMAIRSEATAIGKIIRKSRKAEMFSKGLKRGKARSHKRGADSLTCGEAEVDAILSEGEST
jgi:hypothetical protein